jgi:hypothetical protein
VDVTTFGFVFVSAIATAKDVHALKCLHSGRRGLTNDDLAMGIPMTNLRRALPHEPVSQPLDVAGAFDLVFDIVRRKASRGQLGANFPLGQRRQRPQQFVEHATDVLEQPLRTNVPRTELVSRENREAVVVSASFSTDHKQLVRKLRRCH